MRGVKERAPPRGGRGGGPPRVCAGERAAPCFAGRPTPSREAELSLRPPRDGAAAPRAACQGRRAAPATPSWRSTPRARGARRQSSHRPAATPSRTPPRGRNPERNQYRVTRRVRRHSSRRTPPLCLARGFRPISARSHAPPPQHVPSRRSRQPSEDEQPELSTAHERVRSSSSSSVPAASLVSHRVAAQVWTS